VCTFHPPQTTVCAKPVLRALEGIKDKLRFLSEQSGTAEHAEKEGDRIAVCDLADDLRDVIVEYQVSTGMKIAYRTVHSSGS